MSEDPTTKDIAANLTDFADDIEKCLARIARLEAALKEITEKDGMTMLGECCPTRFCSPHTEGHACTHQYGVARGFSECASIARTALEVE